MRNTIKSLLISGFLLTAITSGLGYKHLLTDERRLVAAIATDVTPNISLNHLDAMYLQGIRFLALQGNATAQTLLGARYEYGQGVSIDPVLTLKNYRAAAEKGNSTAELMLGRLYDPASASPVSTYNYAIWKNEIHGTHGEILLTDNLEESRMWYGKAAEQGNIAAEVKLGQSYGLTHDGDGADRSIAAAWYQKAAEHGNVTGQLRLGLMYISGKGVQKDEAKGIDWLTKAAAQGSVYAEFRLGTTYENGDGLIHRSSEAAKWYLLAAQRGYAPAQYNLGKLYATGAGVPRDYIQAYIWLNKAAARDIPKAAEARDQLESQMTPGQLEQAQNSTSVTPRSTSGVN